MAFIGAVALTPVSSQQPPRAKPTTVLKQAIPEHPGYEVVVVVVDIPPGAMTPPHRHPGHVLGYVLEGSYKIKIDDGPEQVLTKGQTFQEPAGHLHAVSGNPSQTEPAKIIAYMVSEIGKPILMLEKQ